MSFVSIIYDSAVSFVAQAGPCALSRWPTYGHVRYNSYYVDTDITKTGDFQNNVYTTMHEITHILGVSGFLFTKMWGSYTSSTYLTQAQYQYTDANGRNYIITPNVQAYVQNFFTCSSSTIGGLIEE